MQQRAGGEREGTPWRRARRAERVRGGRGGFERAPSSKERRHRRGFGRTARQGAEKAERGGAAVDARPEPRLVRASRRRRRLAPVGGRERRRRLMQLLAVECICEQFEVGVEGRGGASACAVGDEGISRASADTMSATAPPRGARCRASQRAVGLREQLVQRLRRAGRGPARHWGRVGHIEHLGERGTLPLSALQPGVALGRSSIRGGGRGMRRGGALPRGGAQQRVAREDEPPRGELRQPPPL